MMMMMMMMMMPAPVHQLYVYLYATLRYIRCNSRLHLMSAGGLIQTRYIFYVK